MTNYTVTKDWPDTITFDRLHALAKRGYRAALGIGCDEGGFSRIDLAHPKVKGAHIPPKITLWSNGIVATRELLWPSRYVPQEDGSMPGWQKFIDVSDDEVFQSFVHSVPLPTVVDLYIVPGTRHAKIFLARFTFAASLCFCVAGAIMMVQHALRS